MDLNLNQEQLDQLFADWSPEEGNGYLNGLNLTRDQANQLLAEWMPDNLANNNSMSQTDNQNVTPHVSPMQGSSHPNLGSNLNENLVEDAPENLSVHLDADENPPPSPTPGPSRLNLNNNLPSDFDENLNTNETPPPSPIPGPSNENANKLYELVAEQNRTIQKYNADCSRISIRLIQPNNITHPEDFLKNAFDEVLHDFVQNDTDSTDKVGITIDNEDGNNRPIYITYRDCDQMTSTVILNEFAKVLQSNENFFIDKTLNINITKIRMPVGRGRNKKILSLPFDEFCKQKKSILQIANDDTLCLPRAIVLSMAYINRATNPGHYKAMNRKNTNRLKLEALKLCQEALIQIGEEGAGIEEIKQFQDHLEEYTITVFDGGDRRGRRVLFKGEQDTGKYIDLIYGNHHFNVITSLTGTFSYAYYCRNCNVGYDHKYGHQCKNVHLCLKCLKAPECNIDAPTITCNKCNRFFYGQECYDNHLKPHKEFKKQKKSVCDEFKYCPHCSRQYSTSSLNQKRHLCHHYVCNNCNKQVPDGHLCFVRPLRIVDPEKESTAFLFFDFECRVDSTPSNKGGYPHIPNYCVLQQQCSDCLGNSNINEDCTSCGKREYMFKNREGDALIENLMEIMSQAAEKFDKVYIFAHNGGGYDFQFILEYMIRVEGWTPTLIMNGSKIVSMRWNNYVFKDTLNFFHTRLAALPKMFGLEDVTKGYFPHRFNLSENQTYVGELPAPEFYGPEQMSSDDRGKFFKWYDEEKAKNIPFDFQAEIAKYCRSDVEILRNVSLQFRKLYLDLLKVDPLTSSATIASACMRSYRTNFMPRDTIPLMPFKSYRMQDNQSNLAVRYIRYFENRYNVELQSAYRGREKKLGRYRVDGYCPAIESKKLVPGAPNKVRPLILEIHGCYFHGCPDCFPNRTMIVGGKSKYPITMQARYENTVQKMNYLRKRPDKPIVVEKWECQIYQDCQSDVELKKHMTDSRILTHITSNREPFFGGRTETFRGYYKADVAKGEKIRYLDVNSLYPFINKYGVYPIGHPEVLLGDDIPPNLHGITGIAKVRVLPPKQLFLPVLPVRTNNKLIFSLCRTCAEKENCDSCDHSDSEREIVGVFTCHELRKAMSKGYNITEISEVWSYQTTTFDKATKTGGLFAGYIDLFLKIKQEASGYPSDVISDQQKEDFIRVMEEREGITLDPSKIQYNPGLRSLSKLCLNSLWGKFGQRNNMGQTTLIETEARLYDFLADQSREVTSINIINGETPEKDIAYVQWRFINEEAIDTDFVNPIICAYVTAQARLELYNYMEKLGDRILYCDTDSIIYIERPGDVPIETGPYLGQMGDELAAYGEGAFILEFVSGGPKNYSMKIQKGNGEIVYVTKVRGITLNFKNKTLLNFESMKKFVLSDTLDQPSEPIKITDKGKIQRKRHHKVVSADMVKEYKSVPSKRRRLDDYKTLPYGYVD